MSADDNEKIPITFTRREWQRLLSAAECGYLDLDDTREAAQVIDELDKLVNNA